MTRPIVPTILLSLLLIVALAGDGICVDFGDAPTPYPVTLAENGARHEDTGPTLGATRDSEADGTHSADADADGADEDGISGWTSVQAGALGASVTVNVQSGPALLDAWVDWNGDGCWGGALERIAFDVIVADGGNVVSFDVPSRAISGSTIARFRLSSAGGFGPEGAATDGEVEDYRITIDPPTAGPGTFGGRRTVTTIADGPNHVIPFDVDGDGDMDVVGASREDDTVAWYENDGSESFVQHIIAGDADLAVSVDAGDLDGDGDVDVASAAFEGDEVCWYENDGNEGFTGHVIDTPNAPSWIHTADVDGDGDLDVIAAVYGDGVFAWYANNGGGSFTKHTMADVTWGPVRFTMADVDGDGDMDIAFCSYAGESFGWYDNNGSQSFTRRVVVSGDNPFTCIDAHDVDGDGDMDLVIVVAAEDKLSWYENNGSEVFTEHVIPGNALYGQSALTADMDGDGDVDIVTSSFNGSRTAWYENDGSQIFTEHIISTAPLMARCAEPVDMDGDGDLDVLVASQWDDMISWFRQSPVDFGDAPAPYPVTLAENGARHEDTGPTLGSTRDSEADGIHSAAADADGGDEDGISGWTSTQAGALGASVTVNVQSGPAFLDAWVDWNGDGCWGGLLERIAFCVGVADGDNVVSFDVPGRAISSNTSARFRLSSAGGFGPEGAATDGEVEDYLITIDPPTAGPGTFGGRRTITTVADGCYHAIPFDVDGDGDMDVVGASHQDDTVAWYENDGSESFARHIIAGDADSVRCVAAGDLDGDGDVDVASAAFRGDEVCWYENNGSEVFTEHVIDTPNGPSWIHTADVDGDGDLDVIAAAYGDGVFAWYENVGTYSFTKHTMADVTWGPIRFTMADVDGDGDMDMAFCSYAGESFGWYDNNGSQSFTRRVVVSGDNPFSCIDAHDVDGDGDMDLVVVVAAEDKLSWYENNGSEVFTEHVIPGNALYGQSALTADMDGDGDVDIVTSSFNGSRTAWYENDGGQTFTEHIISTAPLMARWAEPVDMDGDGDLDVLVASESDDMISWFEQCYGPMVLTGTVQLDTLVLEWSPVPLVSTYWVFGAFNEPYFVPQVESPFGHRLATTADTTWSSPWGIADPDTNWTYQVIAVDGSENELTRSNRVGEHEFGLP